jgi:hypothetical protein
MANNLGKILEFLEIPQVKLAEYLEITPQALSSIIQSENTKKYNDKIAEFLGLEEKMFNFNLSLEELQKSHLLNLKILYLIKNRKKGQSVADAMMTKELSNLKEKFYLENTIEEVRVILENDLKNEQTDTWQIDTWLIETIVDAINNKDSKYGIIEYSIIKNFLLTLDKVSKTKADFKLGVYQSMFCFISSIKIPEKDINKYIEDLKQDELENET